MLDDLTLSEALGVVIRNPNMLRNPIVFNGKDCHVGYNKESLMKFKTEELDLLCQIVVLG